MTEKLYFQGKRLWLMQSPVRGHNAIKAVEVERGRDYRPIKKGG